MMIRNLFILLTIITSVGCAYNYAVPVTEDNKDISGFRIFGTKPLLVVSSQNTKVIFVPNYDKEYAVKFGAFLAKNDVTLNVTDAQTLTSFKAKPDGTKLVSGILDFSKEAATQGAEDFAGTLFSTATKERIQIYEIIFDGDGNIRDLVPLIDTEEELIPIKMTTSEDKEGKKSCQKGEGKCQNNNRQGPKPKATERDPDDGSL